MSPAMRKNSIVAWGRDAETFAFIVSGRRRRASLLRIPAGLGERGTGADIGSRAAKFRPQEGFHILELRVWGFAYNRGQANSRGFEGEERAQQLENGEREAGFKTPREWLTFARGFLSQEFVFPGGRSWPRSLPFPGSCSLPSALVP